MSDADHLGPDIKAVIKKAERSEKISLGNLLAGDVIEVHTGLSVYTITVINPDNYLAWVESTNERFPILHKYFINGSCIKGGVLVPGQIIIGFNLEISLPELQDRWLTSEIRSARLNPRPLSGDDR